jgi:hypothetical protein
MHRPSGDRAATEVFDDRLFESRHENVACLLSALSLHLCQRCIAARSALRLLERVLAVADLVRLRPAAMCGICLDTVPPRAIGRPGTGSRC